MLLHFYFSENFNCKYTEEIQSAHFGGSKPQITLHTSVCYYSSENLGKPSHKRFCTLSESLRHDPAAITAHLDCVLDKIKKTLVPGLKKIHLVSDGPSTQYKNKTMFYLLANHLLAVCGHYTIGSISSSTKTCILITNQTLKLCQAFKQVSLEHIHTEKILNTHSKFTSQKVY